MDAQTMKLLSTALALLPIAGVGIGVGLVGSGVVQAIGRNPGAMDKIFSTGLVFAGITEALALLAFVVAMMLKF